MTSKIAKPGGGQTDQKKVYLNWANHYLRKSGAVEQLTDLKEIADGNTLPSLLKAVVQEEVPEVHVPVQSEEDRRANIEQCVQFLQKTGLNCSTFNSRDLCDGKDRTILSLFYSLSQFKRKPSHQPLGMATPTSKLATPGPSKTASPSPADSSTLPASRIARPVSPGLKVSHGVSGPNTSAAVSPGAASGNKSLTLPGVMRRTAGSHIMTSTTFDRAIKQRKAPHKAAGLDGDAAKQEDDEDSGGEKSSESGELESSKEVKSDTEAEAHTQRPRSKLSKFGSFSAGQTTGMKDPREGRKSSVSKSTAIAEGAESVTPPSQSKLRGPAGGLSKLQGLVPPRSKEAAQSTSVSNEDPPDNSARKEPPERPQSRLKFLGSGRGTPLAADHSGLHPPRPASQMGRRTSGSTNNLTSSGEEPPRSESRLRMMRKGSDGAIKRHQVFQPPKMTPPPSMPVQSGEPKTSSLPRHLPKESLGSYKQSDGGDKSGGSDEKERSMEGRGLERSLGSLGPGLKKPGSGIKKANSFMCTSIRTPNMPSGPQPTSTEEGRQAGEGMGGEEGGAEEKAAQSKFTPPKGSPSPVLGRGLAPPKSRGDSRLARPISPSTRHKLHKVTHEPVGQTHSAVAAENRLLGMRGVRPQQPLQSALMGSKGEEAGSSSSLESGDAQVGVVNRVGVVNKEVEDAKNSGVKQGDKDGGTNGFNRVLTADVKGSSEEKMGVASRRAEPGVEAEGVTEEQVEKREVGFSQEGGSSQEAGGSQEEGLKESQEHPRYGRRISPEGMSHEEIHMDKLDALHTGKREENKDEREGVVSGTAAITSVSAAHVSPSHHSPAHKNHTHIITVDTDDSESASSTDKESGGGRTDERETEQRQSRASSQEASLIFSPSHGGGGGGVQRARSLSPKASHRLIPRGVARVKDMEGGVPGNGILQRSNSSDSTSSEGTPPHSSKKPMKSALRQNSSSKSRHSSSSSSSAENAPPRQTKVTISPRSSQLVYDPDEACLHPVSAPHGHHAHHITSHLLSPDLAHPNFVKGGRLLGDRPTSFASMDSSTTSESISPSGSSSALYPRSPISPMGVGVARHSSIRSAVSEHLDYRANNEFLVAPPPGDIGSTPELIESFENQLTNMKEALTTKERMLHMYENSMADLSTKMNVLKKSLEEKDNKIRHLTEKNTWFDLEGQSLMADSRAPSVMDHHEPHEPLSDGYLSDSAMDQSKKKKKKPWKFFKSKKKDGSGGGMGNLDRLTASMDAESIISIRTSKPIKRTASKKKTPSDLMSISEYSPENNMRDPETKSTYTVMDMRAEFGMSSTVWEEDSSVKVYEDESAGARAEVILVTSTPEPPSQTPTGDDLYGDILSRHVTAGSKWGRDSAASSLSSDSGNQDSLSNEEFILGTLSVPPEISWVAMDGKVEKIVAHYLSSIDSEKQLGLTEESLYCYHMGDERRQIGNALLPLSTPYEALANKLTIKVYLKDAGQQSCDALAFRILMGKESLQSYMTILQDTHWLVVMGTKGTCKSSLVSGMAQHLSACLKVEAEGEGMEDLMMGVVGGEIVRFNLDKEGLTAPLKYFKTELAKRVQLQLQPPIVVLEDIYECKDLEQLLAAAGGLTKRPFIIAALSSGTTKGVPLHQLMFHYQIRVVSCNPQTDPIQGILTRSLKKQIYQQKAAAQSLDGVAEHLVNWIPYLLNHLNSFINKFHSNSVSLGPRVFMGCPLNQSASELEGWFISLWNHFIIPYLMGTIMAGIETYTADPLMDWVDVREWVLDTYPWQDSINLNKLRTLNPDDVGWNHAVRPHQSRYIMVKDDKMADDTRSLLHHDTRSLLHHDTRSLLHH